MKEKELREKMAGLYGGVPADTHAAFEHALTHHREPERRGARMSKVRFAAVVTLLVMLLATGAYAVYYRFSVTDYMRNTSQAFLDHVITLDETYENKLFTMTVNDLVFDGSNFAVAMNILRHDPESAYYMRTKVTARCAGQDYMVDVEGWNGPDFLAGGMWPEYGGFYEDPEAAERNGFGFEGILWDWDMNPPPAGEPIEWTMTFTVFEPLWEIVVDEDFRLTSAAQREELERRVIEAWRSQQIYMYNGDANSFIMVVADELGLSWDMPWEEIALQTGAFELADVITFRFTTDFDDDVVKEELVGQRYELGGYAAVIDQLTVSFQRVSCTMHLEFDQEMSEEDINALIPNHLSVSLRNAAGEEVYRKDTVGLGTGFRLAGVPEGFMGLGFDFYHEAEDFTSITLEGSRWNYATREGTRMEEFTFTIELP